MDFKELTYFVAIAKYKNITKAADSLFLSQPTLTKFLQQLEYNLNQRLFQRAGKSLILTYAGKRYLFWANQILSLKKDMEQELSDIAEGKSGVLRIGFSSIRGSDIILNVIPLFTQMYPNIQLKFQEVNADSFEHQLLSHNLDLAFFNLPITNPNISYQILNYEEVILVTKHDHQLVAYAQKHDDCRYPWIDLALTKNETFIMLSKELRLHSIVNNLLKDVGVTPNISFYTKNVEAACILASEGMGITFSGEHHIQHTKFNLPPAIFSIGRPCTRRTFVAATRKGSYLPHYAQDLINIVKNNSSKIFDLVLFFWCANNITRFFE